MKILEISFIVNWKLHRSVGRPLDPCCIALGCDRQEARLVAMDRRYFPSNPFLCHYDSLHLLFCGGYD